MNTTHLNHIIFVLGAYFFPATVLSKQKIAMHRGMRKPHELKMRRYDACLVDPNDYFTAFPVSKSRNNIVEMDINEILFEGIQN